MPPTTATPEQPKPPKVSAEERAAALARWESTTVQTLDPLLEASLALRLWEKLVAQRAKPDADALAKEFAVILADAPSRARDRAAAALEQLRAIMAA